MITKHLTCKLLGILLLISFEGLWAADTLSISTAQIAFGIYNQTLCLMRAQEDAQKNVGWLDSLQQAGSMPSAWDMVNRIEENKFIEISVFSQSETDKSIDQLLLSQQMVWTDGELLITVKENEKTYQWTFRLDKMAWKVKKDLKLPISIQAGMSGLGKYQKNHFREVDVAVSLLINAQHAILDLYKLRTYLDKAYAQVFLNGERNEDELIYLLYHNEFANMVNDGHFALNSTYSYKFFNDVAFRDSLVGLTDADKETIDLYQIPMSAEEAALEYKERSLLKEKYAKYLPANYLIDDYVLALSGTAYDTLDLASTIEWEGQKASYLNVKYKKPAWNEALAKTELENKVIVDYRFYLSKDIIDITHKLLKKGHNLIVLIDSNSRSRPEVQAQRLKQKGKDQVTLLGTQTHGSMGYIMDVRVNITTPYGYTYYFYKNNLCKTCPRRPTYMLPDVEYSFEAPMGNLSEKDLEVIMGLE